MIQGTIDIIIVTYQRLPYLVEVIEALQQRTKHPYRLIVVDNGSIDGTVKYLKEMKGQGEIDIIVLNKSNLGLSGALNEGLKHVESEFFITTSDDIVPPKLNPCWLERLIATAEAQSEFGGISVRCKHIEHHNKFNEREDFMKTYGKTTY